MCHEGQPVTGTAIVEQVWKLNFDTMTNVVDVYITSVDGKRTTGKGIAARCPPDGVTALKCR
jgi:hypothetical protein